MKRRIRLLSLSLCFCLLLSMLPPVTTNASTYGDLTYTVSNGEVTITDCKSNVRDYIIVPSTIDGYPVTAIGDSAFSRCYYLDSVYIDPGITSIGNNAFEECWDLDRVSISETVTHIGEKAFYNCDSLYNITIPEGVTTIGSDAFDECCNLEKVSLPSSLVHLGTSVFTNCDNLVYNSSGGIKYLGNENNPYVVAMGPSYSSLYSANINYRTRIIGERAFYDFNNNTNLHSLSIPSSVVTIEGSAFENCTFLSYVYIPDSVTYIGPGAFSGCSGVTYLSIPNSVTYIGSSAFSGCSSSLYTGYEGGLYLGNGSNPYLLFVKVSWTPYEDSFDLHPNTKFIGNNAFEYCRSFTHFSIPDGVIGIGTNAFSECSGLKNISIPSSVKYIEYGVFDNCDSLQDIYFLGNAPEFHRHAFKAIYSNVWYHAGDETWTEEVKQDYSGKRITWCEAEHICFSYTYDHNATCTTDGTNTGICVSCGESSTLVVEGTALGHDYPEYVPNNDATCTTDGTKTGVCAICGYVGTVTDEGTALGHDYSAYISDNNATCTRDGTKTAVCSTCGKVKTVTEKGTALGHIYSDYVFNNDATCTTDGTETARCTRCGSVDTRIAAGTAAHIITSYTPNGDAGCYTDGTKTGTCDRCLETYTVADPGSKGHQYQDGQCIYCDSPEPPFATLTGQITSFDDSTLLTLELYLSGELYPVHTFTTTDGSYAFENIYALTYTLKVSKENHVTRSYDLTLNAGQNQQDTTICLLGDVSGDGRVNVGDAARLYGHVRRTSLITDTYALSCGDANGDTIINIGDAAKIYAHAKRTTALW